MRVTPAGTNTLSMEVDCGDKGERLVLKVVRVGAEVPELARQLNDGSCLSVVGRLKMARDGMRCEVLADTVTVQSDQA